MLRVTSAYRTDSAAALQVIAGVPPIHLLLEERRDLLNTEGEDRDQLRKEFRQERV